MMILPTPHQPSLLSPLPQESKLAKLPRIIPGPMDGISTGSFLTVMSLQQRVRCWFTPFLRISTGVPHYARLRAWIKPYLNTGLPVIAQLMGVNTMNIAKTAQRLHEVGATCVDLNCACPSKTVLSNNSGAARLQHPNWITETLLAMHEHCGNAPISIKLRIGLQSADEFPVIADAVKAGHPDMITLHYRTASELYRPVSDGLARLRVARKAFTGFLLFGSGDLFTVQDILKMYNETGVDGVMPARGLLQNPCLISDCIHFLQKEPIPLFSTEDKLDFLKALVKHSPRDCKSGFILFMVAHFFGRSSLLFTKLICCRTIPQVQAFFLEHTGTELSKFCL